MRKMYLFSMFLIGCVACDEDALDMRADVSDADDARRELLAEVHAPGAALPTIPLDAPEELEFEEASWSEFEVSAASQSVAGSAGKFCCVNCADGWSGWWNRGTGDECNKNGANWCHMHNWNFLNAEWFAKCPTG